jgi:hypothetical protein
VNDISVTWTSDKSQHPSFINGRQSQCSSQESEGGWSASIYLSLCHGILKCFTAIKLLADPLLITHIEALEPFSTEADALVATFLAVHPKLNTVGILIYLFFHLLIVPSLKFWWTSQLR